MILSYVTYYNMHVIQALVLLRVSVKYFGGLDSSYFLEMLREKRKIRKENLPLIQNGSEHKGQNLE